LRGGPANTLRARRNKSRFSLQSAGHPALLPPLWGEYFETPILPQRLWFSRFRSMAPAMPARDFEAQGNSFRLGRNQMTDKLHCMQSALTHCGTISSPGREAAKRSFLSTTMRLI
jgi:hypothetical protein